MSDIIQVDYDPYEAFCRRIGKDTSLDEAKKLWDEHNRAFMKIITTDVEVECD